MLYIKISSHKKNICLTKSGRIFNEQIRLVINRLKKRYLKLSFRAKDLLIMKGELHEKYPIVDRLMP